MSLKEQIKMCIEDFFEEEELDDKYNFKKVELSDSIADIINDFLCNIID